MKNKKIRNIILLFILMVGVLGAGFYLIKTDLENGKIQVLVALEDIEAETTLTNNDMGKFKIEYRDENQLSSDYYKSWKEFISESNKNNYQTSVKILANQVISKQQFVSVKATEKKDPYSDLVNPTSMQINMKNATVSEGSLVKGKSTQLYSYFEIDDTTWMGQVVENMFVTDIETNPEDENEIISIQVVVSASDVNKILTIENNNFKMYFFKFGNDGTKIAEQTLDDVLYNITEIYYNPVSGFSLSSDDFIKLNGKSEIPQSNSKIVYYTIESEPANNKTIPDSVLFSWRGSDISDIYIKHYTLDGKQGENYGRYSAQLGNVSYSSKYDEFSLKNLNKSGYYELELVKASKKIDKDGKERVENELLKYRFIIEDKSDDKINAGNPELQYSNYSKLRCATGDINAFIDIKSNGKVFSEEYQSTDIKNIKFVKKYFQNVPFLNEEKLSLNEIGDNYKGKLTLRIHKIEDEISEQIDVANNKIPLESALKTNSGFFKKPTKEKVNELMDSIARILNIDFSLFDEKETTIKDDNEGSQDDSREKNVLTTLSEMFLRSEVNEFNSVFEVLCEESKKLNDVLSKKTFDDDDRTFLKKLYCFTISYIVHTLGVNVESFSTEGKNKYFGFLTSGEVTLELAYYKDGALVVDIDSMTIKYYDVKEVSE